MNNVARISLATYVRHPSTHFHREPAVESRLPSDHKRKTSKQHAAGVPVNLRTRRKGREVCRFRQQRWKESYNHENQAAADSEKVSCSTAPTQCHSTTAANKVPRCNPLRNPYIFFVLRMLQHTAEPDLSTPGRLNNVTRTRLERKRETLAKARGKRRRRQAAGAGNACASWIAALPLAASLHREVVAPLLHPHLTSWC